MTALQHNTCFCNGCCDTRRCAEAVRAPAVANTRYAANPETVERYPDYGEPGDPEALPDLGDAESVIAAAKWLASNEAGLDLRGALMRLAPAQADALLAVSGKMGKTK